MMPSVGFTDSDVGRLWHRETYMIDDGTNATSMSWIPMQFTGLLDKNGKEIYEGDIVKLRNRNCKVYWADCGFALIREKDNQVWEWNGNLKGYCDGLWGGPPEIIGNVYENPELLDT